MWLTGAVGKERFQKIKKGRLAIAALACALADAVVFVLYCGAAVPFWQAGIALLELPFGALIAFGKRNLHGNSVLLLVVTMLLSGCFQLFPVRNAGLFCLFGCLVLPVLKAGAILLFRTKQTGASLYEVTLCREGEAFSSGALMDTGNRLRWYGGLMPVILVDETLLTAWIAEAEKTEPQKLLFLPYKGVGGTGLLRGIRVRCELRPDNETVIGGEVAAVTAEHKLFAGCAYRVILQPEVLSLPALECVNETQEGERNAI